MTNTVPIPEEVDYVDSNTYTTGWFGDRRPLNSIEITELYFNIQRNAIGKTLLIGLSQVAKDKKVKDFFVRGKDISNKHVEIFTSLLNEEDLGSSVIWDIDVTTSTTETFSEKLMMALICNLSNLGAGYYGLSLSTSARADLVAHYSRLIPEVLDYSKDGANIMFKNNWLEQQPQAANRAKLVKS